MELQHIIGDLDRLMEAAQREAELARDRQQEVPLEAVGSALDGKISAKLGPDGRIAELKIDDEAMRLNGVQLAREIMAAVNQAWAAGKSADPVAGAVAVVDPAALAARLQELRQESVNSMVRVTDSLVDVMRKIDRRLDG